MKVGDIFFKEDGNEYVVITIENGICTEYEELFKNIAKNIYYRDRMSFYEFIEKEMERYKKENNVNVFKLKPSN